MQKYLSKKLVDSLNALREWVRFAVTNQWITYCNTVTLSCGHGKLIVVAVQSIFSSFLETTTKFNEAGDDTKNSQKDQDDSIKEVNAFALFGVRASIRCAQLSLIVIRASYFVKGRATVSVVSGLAVVIIVVTMLVAAAYIVVRVQEIMVFSKHIAVKIVYLVHLFSQIIFQHNFN